MGALSRLLVLARGISDTTWSKMSSNERYLYLKAHPFSKYKPISFALHAASSIIRSLVKTKNTQSEEERWKVDDSHTLADFSDCQCFVSQGGSTVAITSDHNIISLCKNRDDYLTGSDILKWAVKNGGRKLDAYGSKLYSFYTKNGFVPVCWIKFDPNFAPHDWKPEFGSNHHIVFYRYSPRKKALSYNDFINTTPALNDYDEAYAYRDRSMK